MIEIKKKNKKNMDFFLFFTFFILPTFYFFFQFFIFEKEKEKFLKELEFYELEYMSFQKKKGGALFPERSDPIYGKTSEWIQETIKKFQKRESIFQNRVVMNRWQSFCSKINLPKKHLQPILEEPFENDDDSLIFYF